MKPLKTSCCHLLVNVDSFPVHYGMVHNPNHQQARQVVELPWLKKKQSWEFYYLAYWWLGLYQLYQTISPIFVNYIRLYPPYLSYLNPHQKQKQKHGWLSPHETTQSTRRFLKTKLSLSIFNRLKPKPLSSWWVFHPSSNWHPTKIGKSSKLLRVSALMWVKPE